MSFYDSPKKSISEKMSAIDRPKPGIWRHLLLHSGIIRENLNKTSAIKTTTRESSSQKRTDKATFQSISCQWPVVMATSQLTASILLQWWWRPSFGICNICEHYLSTRIFCFLLLPNYIISWYLQTLSQQQDLSFQDIETQASQLAIQLPPMRLISKGIFMCMMYHPLFAKHHSLTTVHLDHNSKINTFRGVARPSPLTSFLLTFWQGHCSVESVERDTASEKKVQILIVFLFLAVLGATSQLFNATTLLTSINPTYISNRKGGFALTALNVNHDFLQVREKFKDFENFSTNCWNSLKSCLPAQLTVFYRGFLGRKLLIQVRLIR